jgi:proteasome lid subunit RPN8/RPN11
MTIALCGPQVLDATIAALQRGGRRQEERVVLWLARSGGSDRAEIVEVYEPEQTASIDRFHLPPASIAALMRHLGATRRRIVAQVHSHPGRAYHSDVDAEWAIIRHIGALSLVLPRFARTTTVANFLKRAMTYELSADADWVWRANCGLDARIQVTP